MKPLVKTILIAALVIGVVGFGALGIAYAQEGDIHPRDALADLLGLEGDELRGLLKSGTTIQELADEAGVDLEAFREEMRANRQEDMVDRIDEALADGTISQDQADWLLEGLENGYLDGPIFGSGLRGGNRSGSAGGRGPGGRGGSCIAE